MQVDGCCDRLPGSQWLPVATGGYQWPSVAPPQRAPGGRCRIPRLVLSGRAARSAAQCSEPLNEHISDERVMCDGWMGASAILWGFACSFARITQRVRFLDFSGRIFSQARLLCPWFMVALSLSASDERGSSSAPPSVHSREVLRGGPDKMRTFRGGLGLIDSHKASHSNLPTPLTSTAHQRMQNLVARYSARGHIQSSPANEIASLGLEGDGNLGRDAFPGNASSLTWA